MKITIWDLHFNAVLVPLGFVDSSSDRGRSQYRQPHINTLKNETFEEDDVNCDDDDDESDRLKRLTWPKPQSDAVTDYCSLLP